MERLEKLQAMMRNQGIDAIVVTNKVTKQYLGTVTGSGCIPLILPDRVIQFMDGRYQNETYRLTSAERRILPNRAYYGAIVPFLQSCHCQTVGLEDEGISVPTYLEMKEHFDVQQVGNAIVTLRSIKEESEINRIRSACQMTDAIFARLLPVIHAGMTEKELVAHLYFEAFKAGADRMSFEPIVASGWRGSLPHGRPSNKVIQTGELVTIDFGVVVDDYQSDMTRTVGVGDLDQELVRIYETVRVAQQAAVEAVRPGVTAREVDAAARNIISDRGYGAYFTHGLGHGIGMGGDQPMLNTSSLTRLESGMVLTCEPGIYVPDRGGVRIEDVVLVGEIQGEALTKSDKSLVQVG